ncbi:MAG: helicase C-terminal domain-containing protein [Actinomycetota bacterium]
MKPGRRELSERAGELCVLRVIAAEGGPGDFLPLEAAALLLRDGREVGAFSCLVDPGCPPPAWLLRRSGRREEEFRLGRPPSDAAEELLRFSGGRTLLVFAREGPEIHLLSAAGKPAPGERVLEMRQLAWLALPYLRDHSLETLASSLQGEELPWRALEEARLLKRLLDVLLDAWRETPSQVRAAVKVALSVADNPWHLRLPGARGVSSPAFPDLTGLLPCLESFSIPEGGHLGEESGEQQAAGEGAELTMEILSKNGPLASFHPGYEPRPQQEEMAREVARALDDSVFLVVEAGTGVGKSLAYLVPGLLHARSRGSPLIVSTYTKNLQEQLYHRDLPLLGRALGAFDYALLKGRSNYICLRKWSEWCASLSRGEPVLPLHGLTPAEGYAFLASWMYRTPAGDLEEISIDLRLALSGMAERLASRPEDCLRSRCPHQGKCFVERARARAAGSRVVLVNHALLLSQISVSEGEVSDLVLPPYRHLVIDEAHHLEEVATQALTLSFSLEECVRLLEEGAGGKGLAPMWEGSLDDEEVFQELRAYRDLSEEAVGVAEELFRRNLPEALRRVVGHLRRAPDGEALRLTAAELSLPHWDRARRDAGDLAGLLDSFARATLKLRDTVSSAAPDASDQEFILSLRRAEVLAERASEGSAALSTFFLHPDSGGFPSHIRWVELPPPAAGGGEPAPPRINCAPVSVAESLADLLFSRLESVVLTSASLRAPGKRQGFSFFLRRTGLERVEEDGRQVRLLALDSPFDYARRTMLLAVKDLPEPAADPRTSSSYLEEVCRVCEEVIRAVGGRSLVLLTSHQQVGYLHRELGPRLEKEGISCHRQSRDLPNALVLERFRSDRDSVLLATEAFWEGVDVPGESLSAVIMAKLPFRHPGDPVVAGRVEDLDRRGESGWHSYYLPLAVTLFRQGIGRLMRRSTDRGVVVILDPRFLRRSYSYAFRAALPPGMTVEEVGKDEVGDVVRRFFDGGR